MSNVATLPVTGNVEAAWDRYVALQDAADRDFELRTSIDHHIAVVRAWADWRDLFLAWDNRC